MTKYIDEDGDGVFEPDFEIDDSEFDVVEPEEVDPAENELEEVEPVDLDPGEADPTIEGVDGYPEEVTDGDNNGS